MKEYNPHKKCNECINCSLIHFCQRLSNRHSHQTVSLKSLGLITCENPCLSIKEGHCKWLIIRSFRCLECNRIVRSLKEISKKSTGYLKIKFLLVSKCWVTAQRYPHRNVLTCRQYGDGQIFFGTPGSSCLMFCSSSAPQRWHHCWHQ